MFPYKSVKRNPKCENNTSKSVFIKIAQQNWREAINPKITVAILIKILAFFNNIVEKKL